MGSLSEYIGLPGNGPTTSAPPVTTTRPGTTTTPTNTGSPPASTGFVKTSGQKFTLNGQTFTVVGSNAYWMAQLGSNADIDKAFTDLQNAGFTTLRTWGFNDVTSPSGTYYQLWSGSTGTLNTGANGLGKFDYVVSSAKAHGIRLIVALTNNWSDYGGMDVYVKQITGGTHDQFYTNANIKSAFKKYIDGWVSRYKNEPTILAWELANEPRCKGSGGTTSSSCTPKTITAWASEISAYIKSIDPNHLVALGDEGFYNNGGSTYPYQGGEGIDFDANLAITTLDFGTFHAYPNHWGISGSLVGWGNTWITDHAASQKRFNKPVIIEEFGILNDQASTYTSWYNTIVSSGLSGDLIWQAGSRLSSGNTHDDGFAVYPDGAVYAVQKTHSAALKNRG
ncbi:glycoside hydrolase family 5 protein [Botryobasidium botryosum FD-172 SS1]|uniref:mannan endo-1,4-beta-mannosidase n=1 Tax=Botryobasidium botryosum (strain FD-172 SS1) TaxID=930990 RepID=A0A067N0E9_BOTB1|nr:glycoside hydrolase family 5 protein [Botryobasidium botryosum FD-172 SS1]